MKVTKRDGTKEDLNIDKLHKVVMYAVENLTGVSASQVEINSQIQFYEGMKVFEKHLTISDIDYFNTNGYYPLAI